MRMGGVAHHLFAARVLAAIFAPVGTVCSKAILGLPLQYSSTHVKDVAREKRWGDVPLFVVQAILLQVLRPQRDTTARPYWPILFST